MDLEEWGEAPPQAPPDAFEDAFELRTGFKSDRASPTFGHRSQGRIYPEPRDNDDGYRDQ